MSDRKLWGGRAQTVLSMFGSAQACTAVKTKLNAKVALVNPSLRISKSTRLNPPPAHALVGHKGDGHSPCMNKYLRDMTKLIEYISKSSKKVSFSE